MNTKTKPVTPKLMELFEKQYDVRIASDKWKVMLFLNSGVSMISLSSDSKKVLEEYIKKREDRFNAVNKKLRGRLIVRFNSMNGIVRVKWNTYSHAFPIPWKE